MCIITILYSKAIQTCNFSINPLLNKQPTYTDRNITILMWMSVDEHLYQNKALNSKFVLLYKYAVILETGS